MFKIYFIKKIICFEGEDQGDKVGVVITLKYLITMPTENLLKTCVKLRTKKA